MPLCPAEVFVLSSKNLWLKAPVLSSNKEFSARQLAPMLSRTDQNRSKDYINRIETESTTEKWMMDMNRQFSEDEPQLNPKTCREDMCRGGMCRDVPAHQ